MPTIIVQTQSALSAIGIIAQRINTLSNVRPVIVVQNNNAIKAIDVIATRISSLTNVRPTIVVMNNNAIKAIDVIAQRIAGLAKIHPTVTITTVYRTVYQTVYAAKGFHGIVSSATHFVAGESGPENVQITPLKGGGSSSRRSVTTTVGRGRDGGSGGSGRPIIIHLHTMLNGREIATAVSGDLNRFMCSEVIS